MKSLALFVLIACLCIIDTDAQNNKCKENGGNCVSKKSSRGGCATLPVSCGSGKVCCKGKKGAIPKRRCYRSSGMCVKEGGLCVARNENNCGTVTVDSLCKGASCSCCIGEKKFCNSLPGCKLRGGFCMNSAYVSTCSKVDAAACAGTECSCCYPRRSCTCGMANSVRIIGGEEVSPKHKYPWMAAIADVKDLSFFICGASIINDLYVLTVGHCVFDQFGDLVKPSKIKIAVGEHNRVTDKENVPKVTKYVDVKEIIVHEKYDPNGYNYDIALIKLKQPLDLTTHEEIRSVCLPSNPDETYEGKSGIVTGWGLLDYEDPESVANTLQEVSVPILSPACEGDLPSYIKITKNMMCAGYVKGGKDACKGDSGGPLVVKEGNTHTIVGMVSFGFGCADRNVPGVYTRVNQYLDWIAKNTADAYYCS